MRMTSSNEDNQVPEFDLAGYKGLFLEQSALHLSALRQGLVQLEQTPGDQRVLREARRAAHTLKGMAAMMHYEDLTGVAARLEGTFLDEVPLTAEQIDALLAGCDELEMGLEKLEQGDEG
jgi:two-component system chemotaxis sensor kinase CheA